MLDEPPAVKAITLDSTRHRNTREVFTERFKKGNLLLAIQNVKMAVRFLGGGRQSPFLKSWVVV